MKEIATSKNYKNSAAIVMVILSVAAVCMLFWANSSVPFMMDDFWYSTNLSTGETLSGFSDVIESQIWHYLNWGGRSITHGFLQFSLMTGERTADVINTLMTIILVVEMAYLSMISGKGKDRFRGTANRENLTFVCLMFGLLITCCPNIRMSMLWQAGCANYVYSSVWILVFYAVYIRVLDPNLQDYPGACIFMIPLGLITGWSTENMGPSSFVIAALITAILYKKGSVHGKRLVWMLEGVVTSLAGSVICILAPGNSVRTLDSTEDLALTLPDRLLQMLRGIGDYVFPALVVFAGSLILYKVVIKDKIPEQVVMLLVGALLSYGAMILSPHYPDRAAFGTCVLIEICSGSLLKRVYSDVEKTPIHIITVIMLASSIASMFSLLI